MDVGQDEEASKPVGPAHSAGTPGYKTGLLPLTPEPGSILSISSGYDDQPCHLV